MRLDIYELRFNSLMDAGKADSVANAGSRPRTAEMRTPTNRRDAATELYDMLKRDYASRASRRSPINNGEALQEEEP